MQVRSWQSIVFLILIVMLLLTGCPKTIPVDVQMLVSDAKIHLDMVEKSEGQEIAPIDYQIATVEYQRAKTYLNNYDIEEARTSAQKSLDASQSILQNLYRDVIVPTIKKAKNRIEEIKVEDPETPLQNLLPRLDELLVYSERVARGEELIALDRVIADLDEVLTLEHTIETSGVFSLESDVSFATGKYTLSDKGKRTLEDFFNNLIVEQTEYLDQHPQKEVTVKIAITGYTDTQGFRNVTSVEERKTRNQQLSEKRAKAVSEYIGDIAVQPIPRLFFEQTVFGRGEEVPPGVVPLNSKGDPNRRICKISVYVEVGE